MRARDLILAGMSIGLFVTTAPAQEKPSDMLIPPTLYAVVGAPFAATVVWTRTETKADGTVVNHRRVSRIMRDSAGRQRFEDGQDEAGPQAAEAPTVRLYDPTTHLFVSMDPANGLAKISTMGYTASAPQLGSAFGDRPGHTGEQTEVSQPGSQSGAAVIQEPLPSREIAGLYAQGVRTTTTLPAGKNGGPAITVVDEVWESPQWHMQLLHIHDDPRTGHSEAQVTELSRGNQDEALFHPPSGYAKDNWEIENHFRTVLPKSSPLPSPIIDDNTAAATDRVIAAATAHSDSLYTPYHERHDLTMIDYMGQKHHGSVEIWISPVGFRFELHTDTYNEVRVTNYATGEMWGMQDGILPLRVREYFANENLPEYAMRRILHGSRTIPSLKPETAANGQLSCVRSGVIAQMCFDSLTGFIVSGSLNSEHVEYEGWKKVDTWKYRAGTVRIFQGKNLLVEAKLSIASMNFSPEIFQQTDGLREMRTDSRDRNFGPVPNAQQHRILVWGRTERDMRVHGNALTHVWVDVHGVVTRAEVEDADDAQVAAEALECARKTVYQPWYDNGQPSAFDTTIFTSY